MLIEAAVRITILESRGIDNYREFIERNQKEGDGEGGVSGGLASL